LTNKNFIKNFKNGSVNKNTNAQTIKKHNMKNKHKTGYQCKNTCFETRDTFADLDSQE
jgi:hypothetical protein